MADPISYTPGYSFSGYQGTNPSKPLPAARVDDEFAAVSASLDSATAAIMDIRRSDGALKNGIVGVDALSPNLSPGFGLRGVWASGTAYMAADSVVYAGSFYRAKAAHTASNASRPDLAPATWEFFFTAADISGSMSASLYDPQNKQADVFARANHTGTQGISTIVGLQSALDSKASNTALALKADASALADLAPIDSPALTGTPTATTPAGSDNSSRIATTGYVKQQIKGMPAVKLVEDTTTYSVTTLSSFAGALSAPFTFTPRSATSRLVVQAVVQLSAIKDAGSTDDAGAICMIKTYNGTSYVNTAATAALNDNNRGSTAGTTVRASVVMQVDLGPSERRGDTSEWMVRLYGSAVYTDNTVSVTRTTFTFIEYEPGA